MLEGAKAKHSSQSSTRATVLKPIMSSIVNNSATPQFEQFKRNDSQNLPLLSFAGRWKSYLQDHTSYCLFARAQAATDASGALLSSAFINTTNGVRFAIYKESLAKGGCCKVKIVQNMATQTFCIMKRSTDGEEKAREEATILEKLNLLEGIQFKTLKDGTEVSYIIMKRLPGVTLHDFKKLCKQHNQILSLNEQAQLLLSTLCAIQSLILQQINHGDVHDKNIMFDPSTWQSHFIDFGDACIIPSDGTKNHHQHYDIKHLLQALKGLITHSALLAITYQYLNTWTKLESNLQLAIDSVKVVVQTSTSENNVQTSAASSETPKIKPSRL